MENSTVVFAQDLLMDIKALIKEHYFGTFTNDGQALHLVFNNGQRFELKIKCID